MAKRYKIFIIWRVLAAAFFSTASVGIAAEMPEFLKEARGEIKAIIKVAEAENSALQINRLMAMPLTSEQRHERAIGILSARARDMQMPLRDFIANAGPAVSEYKDFWICNAIYIRGEADFIRQLAARSDVDYIIPDLPVALIDPVDISAAAEANLSAEPGLDLVGAHEAWQMGLTGSGRLVCSFDTGVEGDHPALYHSWRGANGGSIAESWFDPYSNSDFPVDSRGHGTHTMGSMVGTNGPDTVGVAIGAQWIAAGVVDRGGGIERTVSDILAAFEWAADPDGDPTTTDDMPDVINNSWGIPAGYYDPCDATFWEAIDNLEALGIVCVFAAGNEGPQSSTMRTPADRITTQFNSFAVGALNAATGLIASFSSRGPSCCDGQMIKPEIVAPGVQVRSCYNGGGYVAMSGTSMAAPHIAGSVALLRQFNPLATVDQIKAALLAGASDLGPAGEDNSYGHGLVNIVNAIYNMPPPNHPFIHVISNTVEDDNNGQAEPGEIISFVLRIENIGSASDLIGTLTSESPGANIQDDQLVLGPLDHFDTTMAAGFSVAISDDLTEGQLLYFTMTFSAGDWNQAYDFHITVGAGSEPGVATISTDNLEMSFSNFGQFGLGDSSINPFGGVGFRYPTGGIDFMREASFMVAAAGRVSDGARDLQNLPDNDFMPLPGGQPNVADPGIYADYDGFASYSDIAAEDPLGLAITQRCFGWEELAKFIIVEFTVHNLSGNRLEDLRAGIFCDWDLRLSSGNDDIVNYNDLYSLGYVQDVPTGWCLGVRSLTSPASSYRAIDNAAVFADGFSDAEKLQFMTEGFVQIAFQTPSNYSTLLSIGPFDMVAGDSETMAFAFVAGESLAEISLQADLAFQMYPGLTGNEGTAISLPEHFQLGQNYPNPFNQATVIDLKTDAAAQLAIFDIQGRQVRLIDIISAGEHRITWNGTDQAGEPIVSGVYFYRLLGQSMAGKKMILLK